MHKNIEGTSNTKQSGSPATSSAEEDRRESELPGVSFITLEERENLRINDVFTRFPIDNGWKKLLSRYTQQIQLISDRVYADCEGVHLPEPIDVFNAFLYTPYSKVRVVVIGQDPYPTPGDAMGLAFSVRPDSKIPPSLKNIFLEINRSLGIPIPSHGSLIKWATQGVLLLNTALTVRPGKADSHANIWPMFTSMLIETLCKEKNGLIFLLWGRKAEKLKEYIGKNQILLVSSHPSPLGVKAGFDGCNHFKTVNEILSARGDTPIDWSLVEPCDGESESEQQ